MTTREFLSNIAAGNLSDAEKTFAASAIVKLDERKARKVSKPSKTAIANEPVKAAILELVRGSENPMTATDIGTALGITVQKASALARQLVVGGSLVSDTVKIPKKGAQKCYKAC